MRLNSALGAKVRKQVFVLGANKDRDKKTFRGDFYSLIFESRLGRKEMASLCRKGLDYLLKFDASRS